MTESGASKRDRNVLLCYDGSPESERALERVVELASTMPTRVTVISVANPIYRTPPWTGYADPAEAEAHRRLLDQATRKLSDHGIQSETVEPVGDAADAIAASARDAETDLVVVGSRHRRLLHGLLLGSVSAELVFEAPCNVLVVR
jgi:nucleotide-binding universal stress UspA family protein